MWPVAVVNYLLALLTLARITLLGSARSRVAAADTEAPEPNPGTILRFPPLPGGRLGDVGEDRPARSGAARGPVLNHQHGQLAAVHVLRPTPTPAERSA